MTGKARVITAPPPDSKNYLFMAGLLIGLTVHFVVLMVLLAFKSG